MQNSVKKCSRCNGTGMTSDFLGYYEYPCDCRRAVPYQAPPPGDYPPLPKPAHRPYIDDNGNVRAHGGYSDEQLMLYLATDRAQRIEPALEAPAAPMSEEKAAAALAINSALHRIRSGNADGAIEPLEHAKSALAAASQAPAATVEPVPVDPADALRWGANVAETLLSIGRSIGFGRAQQILGEQWEAIHDCAPRGRMGVTVKDPSPAAHALEAPAYVDRTPELHVGDSAFESWYADYNPAEKSNKQRARDAYAAGMGDPLVMAAPAAKPGDLSRALEAPAHQSLNEWFLSLPEGRQDVLRDDKWMLASAAYEAGRESRSALEAVPQAPAAPSGDERTAYIEFLAGKFPQTYSKEDAEHWWDHGHVSALTWKAARTIGAAPAAPKAMPTDAELQALSRECAKMSGGGMGMHYLNYGREILTRWGSASAAAAPAALDPRTPADMLVNGGALKLALNVLRRAGKNEVADELEKTAAPDASAVDATPVKKAARYDWLRDSYIANDTVLAEHFGGSRMQDFDARIDAAIAAQDKEGGAA